MKAPVFGVVWLAAIGLRASTGAGASEVRCTHNIALALQAHKRTAEAEHLLRELFELHRCTFGAEHPVTLGAMHAL